MGYICPSHFSSENSGAAREGACGVFGGEGRRSRGEHCAGTCNVGGRRRKAERGGRGGAVLWCGDFGWYINIMFATPFACTLLASSRRQTGRRAARGASPRLVMCESAICPPPIESFARAPRVREGHNTQHEQIYGRRNLDTSRNNVAQAASGSAGSEAHNTQRKPRALARRRGVAECRPRPRCPPLPPRPLCGRARQRRSDPYE